jgi:hypothetical protein
MVHLHSEQSSLRLPGFSMTIEETLQHKKGSGRTALPDPEWLLLLKDKHLWHGQSLELIDRLANDIKATLPEIGAADVNASLAQDALR